MSISTNHIREVVVKVIGNANAAREPDDQLDCSTDAPLYNPESRLDSLGLVGLLIDIEDELRDAGLEVSLSDERAMSQSRSPFRTVAALVEYIESLVEAETC